MLCKAPKQTSACETNTKFQFWWFRTLMAATQAVLHVTWWDSHFSRANKLSKDHLKSNSISYDSCRQHEGKSESFKSSVIKSSIYIAF